MQSSGLVAPTQKISDDAPYPPSSIPPQNYTPSTIPPAAPNYATLPPANNSYPPQNNTYPPANTSGPKSIPPQNAIARVQTAPPVRAQTAPPSVATPPQGTPSQPRTKSNGVPAISRKAPAFSDPSITPPPKRRWGLIITVLVIDLALAGAGVYLLTEGLA